MRRMGYILLLFVSTFSCGGDEEPCDNLLDLGLDPVQCEVCEPGPDLSAPDLVLEVEPADCGPECEVCEPGEVCEICEEPVEAGAYHLVPDSPQVTVGQTVVFTVKDEDNSSVNTTQVQFFLAQQANSPFAVSRIDPDGTFHAPEGLPDPPEVEVMAVVSGDPESLARTTVTLLPGEIVDVGVDLPWPSTVVDLDVDPLDSTHILAVVSAPDHPGRIYETSDAGLHWQPRAEEWNNGVLQIDFFDGVTPGVDTAGHVYAVRWDDNGRRVYLSTDSGESFSAADGLGTSSPLPPRVDWQTACDTDNAFAPEVIAVHPEVETRVYVAGVCCIPVALRPPWAYSGLPWMRGCVFRSTDAGQTWTETDPGAADFDFSNSGDTYRTSGDNIYVCTDPSCSSTVPRVHWDGEKTIQWMSFTQMEVAVDGEGEAARELLFLSTKGSGLMMSRDQGVNWDRILKESTAQSINDFVVFKDPGAGLIPCGGGNGESFDLSVIAATSGRSLQRSTCILMGVPDGYGPLYNPANASTGNYLGFQWQWLGLPEGVGDVTFQSLGRHPAPPEGQELLYAGGHLSGVIQMSDDGGWTWSDPLIPHLFGIPISSLAIAPADSSSDPPTIFAGTIGRGGILRFVQPAMDD